MGDMTDYYDARVGWEELEVQPDEWLTKEGEVLSMSNMATSHLRNSYNLCIRTGNTQKAHNLENALRERGSW
jgi:hypothetical protein